MVRLSALLAGLFVAASGSATLATETVLPAYAYDHLSCLELAREEGSLIVEISALHPVTKHDKESEAAAHERELKEQKLLVLRNMRRVRCL